MKGTLASRLRFSACARSTRCTPGSREMTCERATRPPIASIPLYVSRYSYRTVARAVKGRQPHQLPVRLLGREGSPLEAHDHLDGRLRRRRETPEPNAVDPL